jgi:hypothetical protein
VLVIDASKNLCVNGVDFLPLLLACCHHQGADVDQDGPGYHLYQSLLDGSVLM